MSASSPAPSDGLTEEHLRQLIALSYEFNATIEIDSLLPRVLDLVLETLEAEAGSLWLLEDEAIQCQVARGATASLVADLELPLGAGIVGYAIAHRESVLVQEVRDDPRFLHQVDEMTGFETQSVLAVPLTVAGDVLGAIEIVNERVDDGVFEPHHQAFLEALADDAAAAIRNAKLFEAEKQARDLAALLELSHEITATFELDRILLSVVNLAGKAIRFDRCVLAIWADDRLRVRAISGESQVDSQAAAIRELERFFAWAVKTDGTMWVEDVTTEDDPRAQQIRESFPDYLAETHPRRLLVLPVEDAEGQLGVLLFEFGASGGLEEWSREAATLLANTTALALRNAQLYADVPFISWLEPLSQKTRALAGIPGKTWLRYGAFALAVILALTLIRLPLRLGAAEATVRAVVQQPARAGISGIVEAVWVREGEQVAAGMPIADVRDEELLSSWRDAQAGLDLAAAELQSANARGDAVGAGLARVRLNEHRAALDQLADELEDARVIAPAAGLILTSRPEDLEGSYVAAGSPLTWVGDPDWVELELKMIQDVMGEIQVGDRVRAKVNAYPTVTFEGHVSAIAPRAELLHGVPSYAVRAVLDNRERLLRPGMLAQAKVITSSRSLATFLFRRPWTWLRMLIFVSW